MASGNDRGDRPCWVEAVALSRSGPLPLDSQNPRTKERAILIIKNEHPDLLVQIVSMDRAHHSAHQPRALIKIDDTDGIGCLFSKGPWRDMDPGEAVQGPLIRELNPMQISAPAGPAKIARRKTHPLALLALRADPSAFAERLPEGPCEGRDPRRKRTRSGHDDSLQRRSGPKPQTGGGHSLQPAHALPSRMCTRAALYLPSSHTVMTNSRRRICRPSACPCSWVMASTTS